MQLIKIEQQTICHQCSVEKIEVNSVEPQRDVVVLILTVETTSPELKVVFNTSVNTI